MSNNNVKLDVKKYILQIYTIYGIISLENKKKQQIWNNVKDLYGRIIVLVKSLLKNNKYIINIRSDVK